MRVIRRFSAFAILLILCAYAALKFRDAGATGFRPAVESIANDASFGGLMAYGLITKWPSMSGPVVLVCEPPYGWNGPSENAEQREGRRARHAREIAFYAAQIMSRTTAYNEANHFIRQGMHPVMYLPVLGERPPQYDGFPTAEAQSCWARGKGYTSFGMIKFGTGQIIR